MKKIQLIQDLERAKTDEQYAKYTFLINQKQRDKKEQETVIALKEELISLKRLALVYLKRQKKNDEADDKQIDMLIDAYLQYGNLKEKDKERFLSCKIHKKEKVLV